MAPRSPGDANQAKQQGSGPRPRIIPALKESQERLGFLPEGELKRLAEELGEPIHRLHEVASSFPHFRLEPPPRVDVRICRDMACHRHGAKGLTNDLAQFASQYGERTVQVAGVSCLGQCDSPVAVVINDHVLRGKSRNDLERLIESAVAGHPLPHAPLPGSHPGWKIDPYGGKPEYRVLQDYIRQPDPIGVLKKLEESSLRGLGGAGFPTSEKWWSVWKGASPKPDRPPPPEPPKPRYIVVNGDESEPGTFKDRELLRLAPHLVIEGAILAGLVVEAERGYLYIRHEYEAEIAVLEEELRSVRQAGLLGRNLLGSGLSFELEVYISPGGYICGEESALLEAIEDRRAEPRNKPPFPTVEGLYGKPTVINNVETMSWVPGIVLHGGAWYRDGGVRGAKGMRFVSISGDVARPGVYETPFGITVRELVLDLAGGMRGGQTLQAIAPSGPSGGFLPAQIPAEMLSEDFRKTDLAPGATHLDVLDLVLDTAVFRRLGAMLGAAFVVYGSEADMLTEALNCIEFYRNESCGKCVPCRIGSQKLVDVVLDMTEGKTNPESMQLVRDLDMVMRSASICGLGQVAPNPITSVMRYFPHATSNGLSASPS